jgi:hypothetical protein
MFRILTLVRSCGAWSKHQRVKRSLDFRVVAKTGLKNSDNENMDW